MKLKIAYNKDISVFKDMQKYQVKCTDDSHKLLFECWNEVKKKKNNNNNKNHFYQTNS